ncbi:condensation domain-containing protein [Stackebrandtia albiflava]|uniref:Condensation domain-containing protein n=1 Tax=Stackebrandtia albiflava TaxID=406432 RepID=A0A562VAT1_9ACTN|nr:condensation domain-containing protein [Stackebrandtia albiflava]TWJ14974.1 condensation domain-containing protein [Stackebrandtia albiflava]
MNAVHPIRRLSLDDVQVHADGDLLRYDAPESDFTDDRLAALRDDKAALLAWLRDTDPQGRVAHRAPSSHVQAEVWRKARRNRNPVVYTLAQRWHITGPFDVAAFTEAVGWWHARHAALRTRFTALPDDPDDPVIEVLEPWDAAPEFTDLTVLPEPDRTTELERLCRAAVERDLPLTEAPLWSLRLWRLEPERHVLLWRLHHAIVDGTAMARLQAELMHAYRAFRDGGTPELPDVTTDLADYARDRRRAIADGHLAEIADYWRTELDGAPLRPEFAYDRPRPERLSGEGAIHEFGVPAEVLAGLRATARHHQTTLYIVMLTAYAVMLAEFTGQSEVVLPVSYANRSDPRHADVVGMLSERVPIRVRLAEADDFADLVDQVGHRVFEAMDHQGLPLSVLLSELPPDARPRPDFPHALFTLLDGFEATPEVPGLDIESASDAPQGAARMDFYCFMTTGPSGLRGWLEYSTDVFDADTVAHWITRFTTLLTQAATGGDSR